MRVYRLAAGHGPAIRILAADHGPAVSVLAADHGPAACPTRDHGAGAQVGAVAALALRHPDRQAQRAAALDDAGCRERAAGVGQGHPLRTRALGDAQGLRQQPTAEAGAAPKPGVMAAQRHALRHQPVGGAAQQWAQRAVLAQTAQPAHFARAAFLAALGQAAVFHATGADERQGAHASRSRQHGIGREFAARAQGGHVQHLGRELVDEAGDGSAHQPRAAGLRQHAGGAARRQVQRQRAPVAGLAAYQRFHLAGAGGGVQAVHRQQGRGRCRAGRCPTVRQAAVVDRHLPAMDGHQPQRPGQGWMGHVRPPASAEDLDFGRRRARC